MTRDPAWILTIGDELMRGEIVDSNKSFLSERLLSLEIEVARHVSVPDRPESIEEVLRESARRAEVVIVSGGLGPTRDDLTTEVAARTFGRLLVRDCVALEGIRAFFASLGRTMAENNAKQADFPEGADILPNPLGTAPGFMLEVGPIPEGEPSLLFFLPGVPRELYRMMEEQVLPRIVKHRAARGVRPRAVRSALLRTFGVGESNLDRSLDDLVRDDPDASLGFRTQFPDNLVRIVVRDVDPAAADAKLQTLVCHVCERLGSLVVSDEGRWLWEVVGDLLIGRKLTIAVAESCTGGLLSSRLTDVPGSSAYLRSSWIAYSNESKVRELGVSAGEIERHGAVSEPVVRQMAQGARTRSGADIGLATSGIAGPGGGTPEKPVGTVWVAIADQDGTMAQQYPLGGRDRALNKELATHIALDWIRRRVLALPLTESTFPRPREGRR